MNPQTRTTLLALALLVAGLGLACRSSQKIDPILQLSATEALTQGKQAMSEGRYAKARPLLAHAFEVSPNSEEGREALLLVADAYFQQGGSENLVQAESRYRDFLNRFPTSQQAAYAQFQIASSLASRAAPADRDQTPTREAVRAYEDLLRLYPDSPDRAEAEQRLTEVKGRLAEHEWRVGQFYFRTRLYPAAIQRFEGLLDQYPGFSARDMVLYHLGRSQQAVLKIEDARATYARLREEHPDSPYVQEIPRLPPPAEPATEASGDATAATGAGDPAAATAGVTHDDGAEEES